MTAPALLLPATGTRSRWVGVGSSPQAAARPAGREAATQAMTGGDPRLVLVFATNRYDLAELLAGVRDVVGRDVPLAGCTGRGQIDGARAGDLGATVMVLGGDGFSVATRLVRSAAADPRAAGAEAARAVEGVEAGGHRVALCFVGSGHGDPAGVVRGAYDVLGAQIPLVGGAAADDERGGGSWLFHGPGADGRGADGHGDGADEVLEDAVVTVALRSEGPLGIGVNHGWRPVGDPMLVTRSTGSVISTIDDEPALDAYLRRLDAPVEVWHDAEAFERYCFTRPFGMMRRRSTFVRHVSGADFATRSVTCSSEIPQGRLVWVMEGDDTSVQGATSVACAEAVDGLAGAEPRGLLVFDCSARRHILGDDGLAGEAARMGQSAPGVPVGGFYTLGEIARTRGTLGFHNMTLVVLALG
jgi:hypothetical protein